MLRCSDVETASSNLGAPVCRLSACNPEYDHELSFAGPAWCARRPRQPLLASIAVTALCASSHQASAADPYPSRRITFVVPYPAGGATDVLGPFACQQIAGVVEADRPCREQVGRRRRHRQRLRRQGAARWLHRAGRHYPDHPGAEPCCEAALRRLQGSRAGHPDRAVDHRSGGPRAAADQVRQGTGRSMPRRTPASLTAPSATPRRPISTANCSRRSPIST